MRVRIISKRLDHCVRHVNCPICHLSVEELELVFTQIDPKEPSRPFGLAVKVHDDKSYEGVRSLAGSLARGQRIFLGFRNTEAKYTYDLLRSM